MTVVWSRPSIRKLTVITAGIIAAPPAPPDTSTTSPCEFTKINGAIEEAGRFPL